jgi:cell division protein FtsI/penicillin-binding protein 2
LGFTREIQAKRRLNIITAAMGLCFVVIVGRLFQVQVVLGQEYEAKATSQQSRKFQIPASRGQVYLDENGELYPVALNQKLNLLYVDPKFITQPEKAAKELAEVTGLDKDKLKQQLTFKKSRYVELKQRVSSDEAARIRALKTPGVVLRPEDYRYYPEGSLFSHILGYVNSDGEGQYGLEQYLDTDLTGRNGLLKAATDSMGVPIVSNENTIVEPKNGQDVVLTIDRSIQAVASEALVKAVQENRAESGSIIVMDPQTGAVKALVNYPDYDPNNYGAVKGTDYGVFRNRAVTDLFEPGSGFKVITMASALDAGRVDPDTTYNDTGEVEVSGKTIRNAENHKYGVQTMYDVIQKSLNTGMVFILKKFGSDPNKVTRAGKDALYGYIQKFGFGVRTGIEQSGEATATVKPPSTYDIDYANMTFGQGIAVTSIQLVQAVGAIANGGKLYQPYLVDGVVQKSGEVRKNQPKLINSQVVSSQAAAQTASMMTRVVEKGSGWATKMPGYSIAGKTGTAQVPKADGTGYEEVKNIGSFVGFAPVEDPKFVMLVRIDYPKVEGFAEKTAVPAFATVAKALMKYYQIPPKGSQ